MNEVTILAIENIDFSGDPWELEEVPKEPYLRQCPLIKVDCKGITLHALVDTGCVTSIVTEGVIQRLLHSGIDIPMLPMSRSYIIGANKKKSGPINKQVLLELVIGAGPYDIVCIVAKELLYPLIIGMDFLRQYAVIIDLQQQKLLFPQRESVDLEYEASLCEPYVTNCIQTEDVKNMIYDKVQGCTNLDHEQKQQLLEVLLKYKKVFEKSNKPVKDFQFEIKLNNQESLSGHQYRIPEAMRDEVDLLIQEMLEDGIIVME